MSGNRGAVDRMETAVERLKEAIECDPLLAFPYAHLLHLALNPSLPSANTRPVLQFVVETLRQLPHVDSRYSYLDDRGTTSRLREAQRIRQELTSRFPQLEGVLAQK